MKLAKPGRKEKKSKRDKKELDARNQSCVSCGVNDGTICSAHYTGPLQHEYGKCMGSKGDDEETAFLCHVCHAERDQYKKYKGIMTYAEKWKEHEIWIELIRRTKEVKKRMLNQV
jgi:hypothetical protein